MGNGENSGSHSHTEEGVVLTEIERQRIKLEEHYRNEVQRQLAAPSSNLLAGFLNSNFGIWLLSAIFITGAGSLFARWQSAREDHIKEQEIATVREAKIRETIERLDLEIGYRFSQVQVRLYTIFKMKSGERHLLPPHLAAISGRELVGKLEEESRNQVQRVLENMTKSPGTDFQALYPEYVGFGLPALVAELKRHIADNETSSQLNRMLGDLTGLGVFLEVRKASLTEPEKVAGAFIGERILDENGMRALILARWKKSNWYFLDGTTENPFP